MPARVREFCAETSQPEPPDTATLLRVILESLAHGYTLVVEELAEVTGRPVEQIHIVGGGVNNELLCQLTADISGRQVVAGPGGGDGHRQHRHPGYRCRRAGRSSGRRVRSSPAPSPAVTYEPSGDWSEARGRFADMLAARSAAVSSGE